VKDLVQFIANLSIAFLVTVCTPETGNNIPVSVLKTGTDLLIENKLDLLNNKNVAVVANHTSLLANGVHITDTLASLPFVNLKKIFSPEHGYKGTASAGELINETNSLEKIEIISLYGKKKKSDFQDIKNIDVVIFDIQDLGTRFYTYISTLYYIIETCGKYNKKLIILDRPNPIANLGCSGISSDKNFISFISIAPIPVMHGMTVGELSLLFNNEYLNGKTDISVIKMKGWQRAKSWYSYKLNWIKPSPNIPDFETALLYPMNCFIEGLNISEGRGTYSPFKIIGAPFIDSKKLLTELKKANLSGIEIAETSFTPVKIKYMSKYPKYKNKLCKGISFKISAPEKYKPIQNAVKLIKTITKIFPEKIKFRTKHFDLLWGNDSLRILLETNKLNKINPDKITLPEKSFLKIRKKYLLY